MRVNAGTKDDQSEVVGREDCELVQKGKVLWEGLFIDGRVDSVELCFLFGQSMLAGCLSMLLEGRSVVLFSMFLNEAVPHFLQTDLFSHYITDKTGKKPEDPGLGYKK